MYHSVKNVPFKNEIQISYKNFIIQNQRPKKNPTEVSITDQVDSLRKIPLIKPAMTKADRIQNWMFSLHIPIRTQTGYIKLPA